MADKKKSGVEPFEPEEAITDDEATDTDNDGEDEMAKETAKAKSRRAAEVEDDEDDDDEEVEETDDDDTDDETDEDEESDDDDDDDDEEDDFSNFKPFIVHEDQEWELEDVLANASGGEVVTLYHLESGHWYKLQPIKVGEVPES